MKLRLVPYLVSMSFLVVVGMIVAQEPRPFTVAAPPPHEADEDVLMYWNSEDGDEGPDVEWSGTASAIASARPLHVERRRMLIRGESGPWLGVVLSDISPEKAKELKLASENGARVKEVREESPAAKAGLMKDDVIVEFAGEKVRSAAQLRRLVLETPVDRNVVIAVHRAGKTQTLTAKLEPRHHGPMAFAGVPAPPGEFNVPVPPPVPGKRFDLFVHRGARLGISGDDLTAQLAEFFGVKQGKGVLVREVTVGSAAEKGGLKAGDVIVAVDGKEVSSVSKLRRVLAGEKEETEKRKVSLTIVRDKREQTLSVELDAPDRVKPRPFMRAELDVDHEAIEDFAEDMAAQAKEFELEWREHAKELADEQQALQFEREALEEEMQQLREELPKLEQEIRREVEGRLVGLERI